MIRQSQVVILVVAGVALAAGGLWLVSHHGTDTLASSAQVLPLKQADLNGVTGLKIFKGDGSHATLTRDATRWVVSERGYPADTGQVRKLLLDLAALQVEEQKTADPTLYPKLGVEDPTTGQATSTGVDIGVNGKTLALIVGKSSGTRATFVRVPGKAQSLLASPQLAPDADPRHWLDRSILDIAPEQVTGVDLQVQGSPAYTLKRNAGTEGGEFTVSPVPKGREVGDGTAATAQAGALAGLQLDDVRKSTADKPSSQAIFHTRDGLTLTINGLPAGEQRYITVVASAALPAAEQRAKDLNTRLAGFEFDVPGYRYEALFHPLEPLLKAKPAPAAPGAGKPAKSAVVAPVTTLPFGPQGHGRPPGAVTPEQSH